VFEEIPSSTGAFKVVKFFNWCGYTSSNNNNFSLLRSTDSLENRTRIIFVTNSTVGDQLDRDTTVTVIWVSDSSLLIKYDSKLMVFQKERRMDNVIIRYEFK